MVSRKFWVSLIEKAWARRTIVWLSGVRRAGKTFLCRSLPGIEYFDCELPRTRMDMKDPEGFLAALKGKRIVLDEVHRLPNPAELLKIAADHYPSVQVVATGSSTLQASARFRDTLTGRKTQVWLTPMNFPDLRDFGSPDLDRRLLRGGLPPFFLGGASQPGGAFEEWMDSFWARDVQEHFRLERRQAFRTLLELVFAQSGGILDLSRLAAPCEVSRQTVSNYLAVLEATHVVHLVRPFSRRARNEIVAAPKAYAFDTGFVVHARGWGEAREQDKGLLWEHLVLNELNSRLQGVRSHYWRDKRGHEVDFVLPRPGRPPVAIECKWRFAEWDPSGLEAFRRRYPAGENWVVCADVEGAHPRASGRVNAQALGLGELGRLASREGPWPA